MSFSENALRELNIPDDLANKAIDKEWKDNFEVMLGPHNRYTPLQQALEFKTSAALLTLMAGSMLWAYERLRKHTDARIVGTLAEAIFCYQVDPLYLNPIEKYRFIPDTDDAQLAEGAAAFYLWIFFDEFFTFPQFWPFYPPVNETAETIYLTRYIMSKGDRRYEKWAEALIDKLTLIAPLPDARTEEISPGSPLEVYKAESERIMGQPLSPWALNVRETFDPERNTEEIDNMLQTIQPAGNPFLRNPDELQELGFVGTPYRYPQGSHQIRWD